MQARTKFLLGILVVVPVLGPFSLSLAQDTGGLRKSFTIGERIENIEKKGFSSPRNEGLRAITTLDFTLSSRTRSQWFDVQANGGLVYDIDNKAKTSDTVKDPRLRLSYGRENRTSVISLDANYLRTDVDNSNFVEGTEDDDVVSGDGQREVTVYQAGLILGRETPVTLDTDYSYRKSWYSDTGPNDNLSDSKTQQLNGRLSFRLTPVATSFVFARWRDEDNDRSDAADRTSTSYGIGGDYNIDQITTVSAQLSYDKNKSSLSADTDGLGFAVGATRLTPTGEVDFNLSRSETINGARHETSAGVLRSLSRGSAYLALGLTKGDGLSVRPTANAAVDLQLSELSQFSLDLSQTAVSNNEDRETLRTRLSIDLLHDVNRVSSISASVGLANDNVLSDSSSDSRSLSASLSYNHAVAQDWDLVSGLRYVKSRQDGRSDRDTTEIFVGLERRFDF